MDDPVEALLREALETPGMAGSGRTQDGGTCPGGGLIGYRVPPKPPKWYRMGELVAYSGLSRQTIHNYSTMGLLPAIHWTRGGHRMYDESALDRLDVIAHLRAKRVSLRKIREWFSRYDRQRSQESDATD